MTENITFQKVAKRKAMAESHALTLFELYELYKEEGDEKEAAKQYAQYCKAKGEAEAYTLVLCDMIGEKYN